MNILQMLHPGDKTALIQGSCRITYSQLIDSGRRFAGALRRQGIGKNSNVLVFVPLSIDLYTALIGAWTLGACATFIDFSRGAKFVSDSIERLKPDIIVCDNVTKFVRLIHPEMRTIKALHVNSRRESIEAEKLVPEHPAILTFTSGSTGSPKAAVRTHGFLIGQYNVLSKHLDYDESHIDLGTLPVFTLANLAAHMTTLLPHKSYRSKINARQLAKKMNHEGVTRVICSPTLIARLLEHSSLPHLKSAYLGGAPVYPGMLKKVPAGVDLHIIYGSTEAEPISSIRWADVDKADRQKIACGEGLPVGAIVPQIECCIGAFKEILVSGDTVLKGYLDGIGDSESKIHEDGKVWHRTGDAGYFDKNGNLWLLGRVSQSICDEFDTLHPFCVECVLDAHFGIRGAALLRNGERVVVVEKGAVDSIRALAVLNPLHIRKIIFVGKIPMDKRHAAKIDYAKLIYQLDNLL